MASSFYFNNSNRSFTLIELLVVIAIVGLLASIVLVSMGGLQGKAKITKTLEFSQSVDHILGAYAVGWWGFDEGSGSTARDNSGYGNNGIINGAVYTADTPQAAAGSGTGKYALSFDGVNDYVDAGNNASLNLTSLTLTAWLKPNGASVQAYILAKFDGGPQPTYYFYWDGLTNRVSIGTDGTGGGERFSDAVFTDNNAWVFVAVTDDASGNIKFYRNGETAGTPSPAAIGINSVNLFIGARKSGGSGAGFFNGTIDEVRIYEQVLSIGEIQKQYAEGLERHQNLAVK